jgi:hypothetical protein
MRKFITPTPVHIGSADPAPRTTMDEPSYRFRATMFTKETIYRAGAKALSWCDGGAESRLAYADIRQVRTYGVPGMPSGGASNQVRCVLRPRRGRAIVLGNQSFIGVGRFEDRSAAFYPFATALTERIAKANPQIVFIKGMPGALFVFWLILFPLVAIIAPSSAIAVMAMLAQGQSPPGAMYGVTVLLLTFLFAIVPNAKTVWRNRPLHVDPRTGASLL